MSSEPASRPRVGESFLIDANVLLDIFSRDPKWLDWSRAALADAARAGIIGINPLIYAEVSVGFDDLRVLDDALPTSVVRRLPLPFASGFLAAKAHQAYRRRGGTLVATLPDFYIGAHALVSGLTLVTRDPRRFRTAFPSLRLVSP